MLGGLIFEESGGRNRQKTTFFVMEWECVSYILVYNAKMYHFGMLNKNITKQFQFNNQKCLFLPFIHTRFPQNKAPGFFSSLFGRLEHSAGRLKHSAERLEHSADIR